MQISMIEKKKKKKKNFVVANLESLLPKLFKKFTIFCVSIFV